MGSQVRLLNSRESKGVLRNSQAAPAIEVNNGVYVFLSYMM
jgi:hypothetical protein